MHMVPSFCFHQLIMGFFSVIRRVHPCLGSTMNVFRNVFLVLKKAITRLVIRH